MIATHAWLFVAAYLAWLSFIHADEDKSVIIIGRNILCAEYRFMTNNPPDHCPAEHRLVTMSCTPAPHHLPIHNCRRGCSWFTSSSQPHSQWVECYGVGSTWTNWRACVDRNGDRAGGAGASGARFGGDVDPCMWVPTVFLWQDNVHMMCINMICTRILCIDALCTTIMCTHPCVYHTHVYTICAQGHLHHHSLSSLHVPTSTHPPTTTRVMPRPPTQPFFSHVLPTSLCITKGRMRKLHTSLVGSRCQQGRYRLHKSKQQTLLHGRNRGVMILGVMGEVRGRGGKGWRNGG